MPQIDSIDEIFALLRAARTLAIVGLSTRPERDSHSIAAYLQEQGYRILGVTPAAERILDAPCYPSLTEIPEPARSEIDLVVVFRRPAAVPDLIVEAARLELGPLWLQLGVSSELALVAAEREGVRLITEKCIRVVHGRLPPQEPHGP